ncbi:long-chain-fatty-acid--CoA ligase ACSBG2 [Eurytemora carolleeae]|uniref:long-chain-fatty-acid--CoA ligase ACSBG2 n=1 Tax=Eurytemora carolleeae TaxID=1294199 RepID=UPI000C75D43C|nr:long-chain-fatty-acid--CoA ligase ACSBG2 [Eurytemora carolleeae]|eukprot:XP_023331008.1 long-chain-fatty-acid--CoA ligase ACSBG2-like [Eurytemora affinis]
MSSNGEEPSEEPSTGPDRILPATEYTSSDPMEPVKLWMPDKDCCPEDIRKPVSVPTLLTQTASKAGDQPALCVKRGGVWISWTYKEYLAEVRTVAKAFIKLGLTPGHGVGIIGFNSPEWFFSDLGCVFAGGLAAGIYPTNSAEACQYTLAHCRANIVIVEDHTQLSKILAIRDKLPNLLHIVQYSGEPTEAGVLSWSQLMEVGKKEKDTELEARLKNLAPNLCCHLVYTSGTTGPPKGVMLSHDNLTFTARTLVEHYGLTWGEERLVSYLPLSHVAANIMDLFMFTSCAGTIYFANRDALKGTLISTLKEAKPTIFFGVPRVWEKVREKMLLVGKANTGIKKAVGIWAKKTGLEHNKARLSGRKSAKLSYKLADKIVFSKIKDELGFSQTHSFFSAAAPLAQEVIDYFLSLNIRIWEIYGMSEISGPQTGNDNTNYRPGTIGKDLAGFHTKLDRNSAGVSEICPEGGELCMRGRNVFMGYLGNQEKTLEVFDGDGWHHSGDVGKQDQDGFFIITGRIKEILITAGGENVPPFIIENMVKNELPCLSHVMLIGDRKKFLSCLVTLKVEVDQETLEPRSKMTDDTIEWCKSVGSKAETVEDVLTGPDVAVMDAIQKGMDRYNKRATSNAQRIQKWMILPADFSIPGGEIGPTMKVKRHAVLKKYQEKVEKLYES